MPKKIVTPDEERFAELVGQHGYRPVDAVREIWPHLTLNSTYTKVRNLSKKAQLDERIAHYNAIALQEPRRLLKIAHRTAATILRQEDHKHYASVLATIGKQAGIEQENAPAPKVDITIKFDAE